MGVECCTGGFDGPGLEVVHLASIHIPLARPLTAKEAGKCCVDVGPVGKEGLFVFSQPGFVGGAARRSPELEWVGERRV